MTQPQIIRYTEPFPPMTGPPPTSPGCDAETSAGTERSGNLYCTRSAGHEGNHEAGGMAGQKIAEWK